MYRHYSFFFFNDTATTEIYTLSLHDALPISLSTVSSWLPGRKWAVHVCLSWALGARFCCMGLCACFGARTVQFRYLALRPLRSEEHTSELQSRQYLVCRLLLEKKKTSALNTRYFLFSHLFVSIHLITIAPPLFFHLSLLIHLVSTFFRHLSCLSCAFVAISIYS